mmetsp:Transcript_36015/g.143978  ORF Transcript_36015/g.143978 Transcript_36015/m.143978 type:complete len:107 (+) Transcript_36015:1024-1344(+)
MQQAEIAVEELRMRVDTLIVVSNDKLLQIVPDNAPLQEAFLVADDILRQGRLIVAILLVHTGKALTHSSFIRKRSYGRTLILVQFFFLFATRCNRDFRDHFEARTG